MTWRITRNAVPVGLGTAATLALALGLSGCGGTTEEGQSVVVTEPGAAVPTAGTTGTPSAGSTAPAASTSTASTSTSPTKSAAATKAEGWGTLKGQIVFGGDPPSPPVLEEKGKAEKDPTVCAKDAPIVSERLIVDKSTKGVKNALVYIPRPTAVNEEAKSAAAKTEVEFDQDKCIFKPHVLGVMAGSKIDIKSSDPVNHNVNAKLQKNPPFNSILASGQTIPYTPGSSERGPSLVTCDIHPWMQAYWLVLDNPYFAVTDDKGNFEIKNVPAGTQKVVVWQEATQYVTPASGQDVAIEPNKDNALSLTIDPGKVKPAR